MNWTSVETFAPDGRKHWAGSCVDNAPKMQRTQGHSTVPSHLVWSIFNLICCCLPLGIAAVICSWKVENANASGDTARAQEASRTAKILNIIGFVCGIIVIIIVVALSFVAYKHVQ